MTANPKEPAAPPGPQEGRCGAIRKRDADGRPIRWCRKYPMRGQARCALDGGKAPQAIAAATRRQQETAARLAVETFGLRRDISPEDAMLEELQWTAGHVAWLRDRVMELAPEALVWGRTSEVSKEATEFPGVDTTREAAPNVWLALYEKERAHLLAVAVAMLKAGVEERKVRLAERDGAVVAELIRGTLTDLGLDPAAPEVMRVVATRLHALAGAA